MKMKKRVKTKLAKQCTWVQNHMFTFLSLVNKDLLVKSIVFTTNIFIIFERVQISKV